MLKNELQLIPITEQELQLHPIYKFTDFKGKVDVVKMAEHAQYYFKK